MPTLLGQALDFTEIKHFSLFFLFSLYAGAIWFIVVPYDRIVRLFRRNKPIVEIYTPVYSEVQQSLN